MTILESCEKGLYMDNRIKKIMGANMDIDFTNPNFGNASCPWNLAENTPRDEIDRDL